MPSVLIMLVCIGLAFFFSLIFILLHFPEVDARCPDGYHISPSGDCEKVTHSGGLPVRFDCMRSCITALDMGI